MSELPNFGIEPDENGFIHFMTVEAVMPVGDVNESIMMFKALGELALQNPGYLPILRLHYERP